MSWRAVCAIMVSVEEWAKIGRRQEEKPAFFYLRLEVLAVHRRAA